MNAPIPHQPWHLGVLLTGDLEPAGWDHPARPAAWSDAIEFAQVALSPSACVGSRGAGS